MSTSSDLAENHRPISLTSICSKVLEHIVYSSISNFLDNNQILHVNTVFGQGIHVKHSWFLQSMIGPNLEIMVFTQTLLFLIVNVIIRPRGRKIRAYWRYFPSIRGDGLICYLIDWV